MAFRRSPAGIVQGQRISATKLSLAKEMRREMTSEERIFWNHLRQNRCAGFHFRRQQVISGFIADFYCDAARLAIEIDGAFHQPDYDEERDRAFARAGVRVVRLENCKLRTDLASVLELIAAHARERIRDFESRPNP
jgi:very-short-patch-repair endonuclease